MFSPDELQKGLRCRRFGKKIYTFESIDSTNNCARGLAGLDAAEGTVVIAEEQTAGKGRLGRTWEATPGENLTFSIVLRPAIPVESINLLPLGVAVAVARGVQEAAGFSPTCKWPNDLLLGGKKFSGILLESTVGAQGLEYVIVGIGINVNQTVFPDELRPRATSLALYASHPFDRIAIFNAVLASLEHDYDSWQSSGYAVILPAWLDAAAVVGKRISADIHGRVVTGTVRGLAPDGGLQLRTDAGDVTLFAGDVTILDTESYAPGH